MEDLLKALHVEYVAELPAKITSIEHLVREQKAEDVREAFHKLKGTGKTYGLPEVSELAAIVEATCIADAAVGLAMASVATDILRDIAAARRDERPYSLSADPRFGGLRAA